MSDRSGGNRYDDRHDDDSFYNTLDDIIARHRLGTSAAHAIQIESSSSESEREPTPPRAPRPLPPGWRRQTSVASFLSRGVAIPGQSSSLATRKYYAKIDGDKHLEEYPQLPPPTTLKVTGAAAAMDVWSDSGSGANSGNSTPRSSMSEIVAPPQEPAIGEDYASVVEEMDPSEARWAEWIQLDEEFPANAELRDRVAAMEGVVVHVSHVQQHDAVIPRLAPWQRAHRTENYAPVGDETHALYQLVWDRASLETPPALWANPKRTPGWCYGEVTPATMRALCDQLHIDAHDVLLDIGSGLGNVCLYVALTTGCRTVGTEIHLGRHQEAERIRGVFAADERVEVRRPNFETRVTLLHTVDGRLDTLMQDVPAFRLLLQQAQDNAAAPIIFINNVKFGPGMVDNIIAILSEFCNLVHTRLVLTVHPWRARPGGRAPPAPATLLEHLRVPMGHSWSRTDRDLWIFNLVPKLEATRDTVTESTMRVRTILDDNAH